MNTKIIFKDENDCDLESIVVELDYWNACHLGHSLIARKEVIADDFLVEEI